MQQHPCQQLHLLTHAQQHCSPSGRRLASIRLAPDRVSIERNVKWAYRKLSADLDIAIGINYRGVWDKHALCLPDHMVPSAGEPHYHVEVNKLKPLPLVLGIAAVLFATGSTLSSTENVGRFLLNAHPLGLYSSSSWETTASLAKNRRQGLLQIHAMNPLITL